MSVAPQVPTLAPNEAELRILATTDLHLHIMPYDYFQDRPAPHLGLARTATLIKAIRQKCPSALLFDNGDFLQGTPFSDVWADGLAGVQHPAIAAMNLLGYDGATVGNHEFNYGISYLQGVLSAAEYPVVLANIVRSLGETPDIDAHLFPPTFMIDRTLVKGDGTKAQLRVGVIGLAPAQILTWDRAALAGGLMARDMVETAAYYADRLRADGADVVVALCHTGISDATPTPMMENAILPLAAIDGIDAIIGGHTHTPFPTDTDGVIGATAVALPGALGSHLGDISLVLAHDRSGWTVRQRRAQLHPIAERQPDGTLRALVDPDPEVMAAARPAHDATLSLTRQPIGNAPRRLHSFFATVAPDATLSLVAAAQADHVSQQLAGSDATHLPLLSAVSCFRSGGRSGPENYADIPKGKLTMRHASELYPYPNTICAITVTGAMLRDWLEQAVILFRQVATGSTEAELFDDEIPVYNFDVIHGVTYEIDLTQPARFDRSGAQVSDGVRICNLRYCGHPVRDDQRFVVATNTYRADGGGQFRMLAGAERTVQSQSTVRDAIANYMRRSSPERPLPDAQAVWAFKPQADTSAMFLSSAHGRLLVPDGITHCGAGPDGFHRYRLDLGRGA